MTSFIDSLPPFKMKIRTVQHIVLVLLDTYLSTENSWFHCPCFDYQNDLRSAIVKEACTLLEKLSTASGNYMAILVRDILNVLLQLLANGNSVSGRSNMTSVKANADQVYSMGGG